MNTRSGMDNNLYTRQGMTPISGGRNVLDPDKLGVATVISAHLPNSGDNLEPRIFCEPMHQRGTHKSACSRNKHFHRCNYSRGFKLHTKIKRVIPH
jgi:hypothetical protein